MALSTLNFYSMVMSGNLYRSLMMILKGFARDVTPVLNTLALSFDVGALFAVIDRMFLTSINGMWRVKVPPISPIQEAPCLKES